MKHIRRYGIGLGILAAVILFAGWRIWMYAPSEAVVKTAVSKKDLNGTYILCKPERVTGFDWQVISGEQSGGQNEYCNISGARPLAELKYDFILADNTYVFYVEERKESFTRELGTEVEYVVSGWDILYPVRHGAGLLRSPKYLLKSDLVP